MLVMNPELMAKVRENKTGYLFLEKHPQLKQHWQVNSFDPSYLRNLDEVVDTYGAISYLGYTALEKAADASGYKIVFMEDPSAEFEWMEGLYAPVGVALDVPPLSDAVNEEGYLPFQVQGINLAKELRGTVLQWSTGTGKTVGAVALTKWHAEQDHFDICCYVVKTNNKINAKRSLMKLVGLNPTIVDGTPAKREEQYLEVLRELKAGEKPVMIVNYEKFRDDKEAMDLLLDDKRVLFIWDEMPSKLKNRDSQLWRAVCQTLYTSTSTYNRYGKKHHIPVAKEGFERQREVRHVMLSAFPIYNGPGDWFSCISLMDPTVYGDAETFEKTFSKGRDQWDNLIWNEAKLPLMGAMAAFMTHQVDKNDPDIASQFPEVVRDPRYVEMTKPQQRLYNLLQQEYANLKGDDLSMLEDTEILSAINCLQQICSMPIGVLESALEFEQWEADMVTFETETWPAWLAYVAEHHPKWKVFNVDGNKSFDKDWAAYREEWPEAFKAAARKKDKPPRAPKRRGSMVAVKLREKVGDDSKFDIVPAKLTTLAEDLEEHPGKMVVFTKMTEKVMPHISKMLDDMEIDHVVYHGSLNAKQKQAAQDRFRSDPNCKVFLASDAGQDSIDLPEADWVSHYDLPWTYVGEEQRENRAHRLISEHGSVTFARYINEDTVEERNVEIIDEKRGYHIGVFKGKIAEQSQQLRRGDMLYRLTGSDEYR